MGVTLVLSGAIRETAGRKEELGSPLSIVVKPAGVEHRDEVGHRGAHTIQIAFHPEETAALIDRDPVLQNYTWQHGGAVVAEMLALLRLLRGSAPADPAEMESRILDAFGALAREHRAIGTPPQWIRLVKERLDDDLGVSVRELAAAAGVHAVSVSRAFRRHFGRSISEHRSLARLRRAAAALDSKGGHLSRAAHAAGYADHSHLCREFRRATGFSPSEFRQLTGRPEAERVISVQAAAVPRPILGRGSGLGPDREAGMVSSVKVGSTLALAGLLWAGSDAGAQATIGGDWRADVEAFARRIVEARLTPGMAVAVSVGDWVAFADGFGVADIRTARAATGDTPFYIASSTKSLTALAVTLAAHEGKVDIEAPMVRYLPSARLPDGVDRESITVGDLLALTHGLNGNGPVVFRTAYTGEFTRAQLLELLQYHAPTGEKGTFDYNNLGYNLLGLVLEAVYQESWKQVVQRLVLDPIGMRHTTAMLSAIGRDGVALPHGSAADGFEPMALGKDDANLHAAGGHFASARDLARYLAVHASGGMLEGRRVLPREPIVSTQQLRVPQDRRFGPFLRFGWGYGWDLATFEGDTIIQRFGGFGGYRSHMSFMPRHGIGVVVLVNGEGSASPASDLMATYIYDRIRGKPQVEQRFGARLDSLVRRATASRSGITAELDRRRTRLAPLRHSLESYAGVYESPQLGRMTWRVVAAGLEMHMGVLSSRAEVFDVAKEQLRIEVAGSGQVVTFEFPSAGASGPAAAVMVAGERFVRVPAAP
jgi:CubicO group peptidase (beta-lactamase class C family)/AraC-like DNA-binding protein